MNVFLLMSGGVGNRFGANMPKQYVNLDNRPVIEYVLEAAIASKKADRIVVVMDKQYANISKLLKNKKISITNNGSDRYSSLKNGLDYIEKHFDCENVLIADAVAPFIYPELIDDYFNKMDEYDIVLTGQKITGALCDFKGTKYDREEFFMAQAPEAFKFKMLVDNIDYSTKYQAISSLMPKTAKRYVNFNFKQNLKLTYNYELKYAEFLLDYQRKQREKKFESISSPAFFETKGIKEYLLRIENKKTKNWLQEIYFYYTELQNKYGRFENITLNQSSRNGVVMIISHKDGSFVLKLIPPFLNRYENEKKIYQIFSKDFMCDLLDFDDNNNALFIKKLDNSNSNLFEQNKKLTDFFTKVFKSPIAYNVKEHSCFEKIIDNINTKKKNIKKVPYLKKELETLLDKAINYYESTFSKSKLYVIHGDLREENILEYDGKFYAIDPIGYVAPLEMETSRFIIEDIYNNMGYDHIDRLEILLNYFSKWFDRKKLIVALYIFFVMITYNSAFEYEKSDITKQYISLINKIEKMIK